MATLPSDRDDVACPVVFSQKKNQAKRLALRPFANRLARPAAAWKIIFQLAAANFISSPLRGLYAGA
jgi:hypothetical protein